MRFDDIEYRLILWLSMLVFIVCLSAMALFNAKALRHLGNDQTPAIQATQAAAQDTSMLLKAIQPPLNTQKPGQFFVPPPPAI